MGVEDFDRLQIYGNDNDYYDDNKGVDDGLYGERWLGCRALLFLNVWL